MEYMVTAVNQMVICLKRKQLVASESPNSVRENINLNTTQVIDFDPDLKQRICSDNKDDLKMMKQELTRLKTEIQNVLDMTAKVTR